MANLNENKTTLDDETLTTPEHDKLILDLLNKEYISKLPLEFFYHTNVCNDVLLFSKRVNSGNIKISSNNIVFESLTNDITKQFIEDAVLKHNKEITEFSNTKPEIEILSEVPIVFGQYIVGYWDILIKIKQPHISIPLSSTIVNNRVVSTIDGSNLELYKDYGKLKLCRYHHKYNKYIYDDNYGERQKGTDFFKLIYVEVKPKISSFGNTLRQLNKYIVYTNINKDSMYLYTPNITFKSAFESQGIKVITPLK